MSASLLDKRSYGVLMPIFSLPTGTLDGARDYIDFLKDAGASIWQILPLGPTHEDRSPYLALSAHAVNPDFIGVSMLQSGSADSLIEIYQHQGRDDSAAFRSFRESSKYWLPDYTLFQALRLKLNGKPWYLWPESLRDRHPGDLEEARLSLEDEISFETWRQFQLHLQWQHVRSQCEEAGIALFGDMPLYVSHDSVDVWVHRQLFKLNQDGTTNTVAGVPPDYFSPNGQLWGNPIFDWQRHMDTDFAWWIERVRRQLDLFHIVRLDHFRGLESYWEVPGSATDAVNGQWSKAPGAELLSALYSAIPELALVAEDLGTITAEVDTLREQFAIPGIRVLQFGFDGVADNPHAPTNVQPNMLLYTGTHDNDTSVGWYQQLSSSERLLLDRYLSPYDEEFPFSFIMGAMANQADTVVIPMQDLLGLGSDARTNTPGTTEGNWCWSLPETWPREQLAARIREVSRRFHRTI